MTKRATAATAMANMIQKLSMFCAGFDVVLADRDAKSIQNYKFVEISFFPGGIVPKLRRISFFTWRSAGQYS